MIGLYGIKKWYTLEAAAARLSQTFGQHVGLMDVIQFIVENQMTPFVYIEREDLLPYRAVRFRDEAGEPCFDWDKKDLKSVQTGIYEVLFAHGEFSGLKRNLRRFLKGESPDKINSSAIFIRDADGEVYYIIKTFKEITESWGLQKPEIDTGQLDTIVLRADGKPFKRYEYPTVVYQGDYGLAFSTIVPDVSEIIITKQEMERFEKVALGGAQHVVDWAHKVRSEATRWYVEQIESNRTKPTKIAISKEMAVWCRNNEITTDTQEYPSAEYIRRHVLNRWSHP